MDKGEKDELLATARAEIARATGVIGGLVARLDASMGQAGEAFRAIDNTESETAFEDRMRAVATSENSAEIREGLAQLALSPYFARLDVAFEDVAEQPDYIAKHAASEL